MLQPLRGRCNTTPSKLRIQYLNLRKELYVQLRLSTLGGYHISSKGHKIQESGERFQYVRNVPECLARAHLISK